MVDVVGFFIRHVFPYEMYVKVRQDARKFKDLDAYTYIHTYLREEESGEELLVPLVEVDEKLQGNLQAHRNVLGGGRRL